ncbi:MAG: ECF subfamily [Verrucomicrobia bacterium]|nr:MAG: ECF subfamily [Verrucomicrobiota bacterium]
MRDRHVFGLETTELLAAEAEEHALRLEIQREVLGKCLQKLTAEQRSLLENAYAPAARIDTLAEQKGLTPMTLYKKLHRLRLLLAECTRRAFELKNDL